MQSDDRKLTVSGPRPGPEAAAYRRWESGFINDLSFTETTQHGVVYGAHVHDVMEIIWVLSGRATLTCRDRSFTMHPGDAVIIAPNEVHAGGPYDSSGFSFCTLHVPRAALESVLAQRYLFQRMPPVQLVDGRDAKKLYRELIGGLPNGVSLADQLACLSDVLGSLFKSGQPVARPVAGTLVCHPAVTRAKTIINESYAEPIDFSRLATELRLHQRYLIALFKTVTGIPPHQYQLALRVDLARRLLGSGLPLSHVACNAGFADQSHLNRHFKRIYRLTPGAFRKQTVAVTDLSG